VRRRVPATTVTRSIRHRDATITFELVRSDRRTLGLTVHHDGVVVVRAPRRAPEADVLRSVAGRADWVVRKQREFAESAARNPPLRCEQGETHLYLGRPYPLALEQGEVESVRLAGGALRVTVHRDAPEGRVRDLLDAWYVRRARRRLPARLDACWATFPSDGHQRPALRLKRMRTRWGSATPSGKIALNIKLVQVPTRLIDYVLLHELCHLAELHHGRAFYELLGRVLPDWRERREALNRYEFG